eukprot:10668843-Alexandrium_andersonii.AAC.1
MASFALVHTHLLRFGLKGNNGGGKGFRGESSQSRPPCSQQYWEGQVRGKPPARTKTSKYLVGSSPGYLVRQGERREKGSGLQAHFLDQHA